MGRHGSPEKFLDCCDYFRLATISWWLTMISLCFLPIWAIVLVLKQFWTNFFWDDGACSYFLWYNRKRIQNSFSVVHLLCVTGAGMLILLWRRKLNQVSISYCCTLVNATWKNKHENEGNDTKKCQKPIRFVTSCSCCCWMKKSI